MSWLAFWSANFFAQKAYQIHLLPVKEQFVQYDSALNKFNFEKRSDSLLKYTDSLEKLVLQYDSIRHQALVHYHRAEAYTDKGQLDIALTEMNKVLDIRSSNPKLRSSLGSTYNGLANLYYTRNEVSEAVTWYHKAIDFWQKEGDKEDAAIAMLNLGNMYTLLGDTLNEKKYLFEGLRLGKKYNNENIIADAKNKVGIYYQNREQYDSMMIYFQDALEYYERKGSPSNLAHGYNNVAIGYYYMGELPKSLEYFRKGLTARMAQKDTVGICESYYNIAFFHQMEEDLDSAKFYYQKNLYFARASDNNVQIYDAYAAIAQVCGALEEYEQAFLYKDSMETAHSKVLEEQHRNQVQELEVKYETTKKDQEIEQLNQLNEERERSSRLKITAISGIAVLLGVLGLVLYRANRNRRRTNDLLTEQNEAIEESKNEIERKNEEITDSIRYASRIQNAILPVKDELDLLGEHFVLYHPRDIVSGDFYWVQMQGKYKFLVVADCTGHGVPGALVAMMCQDLLTETIVEKQVYTPGEILSRVHQQLVVRLKKNTDSIYQVKDGMDLILVRVEEGSNEVLFAGAINSLLAFTHKGVEEFQVDKESIGGHTPEGYQFETLSLRRDQLKALYLRTDGYQDQFGGPKDKKFMKRRLVKLLDEVSGLPMVDQQKKLDEAILSWKANTPQVDDITIIGVRIDQFST